MQENITNKSVSRIQFESVLHTAVDGIIVIDEKANILTFNEACERLFEYKQSEVIGLNIKMLMPHSMAVQHDTFISNYINSGVKKIIGIGREVLGKTKSGAEFPIELSVGEAHTPQGRQFIGIIRDLRPRKKSEERIQQLQDELVHMARVSAINEMGSVLAHELNQPLTAIMLYIQALKNNLNKYETNPLNEAELALLDKTIKEAERSSNIINHTRSFVEKRQTERVTVDAIELLEEAIELVTLGKHNKYQIHRKYPAQQCLIKVDPVQIQQIFINLIRNSMDASLKAERPELTLKLECNPTQVTFAFTDNGVGISAEAAKNIFKAFSTSKKGGVGLGLAISRSIAQSHGGDIIFDVGGKGKGATFTLILPQTQAEKIKHAK